MINELEAQLDYERLRRERLEAQIDEYRREINYLNSKLGFDGPRTGGPRVSSRVCFSLYAALSFHQGLRWHDAHVSYQGLFEFFGRTLQRISGHV